MRLSLAQLMRLLFYISITAVVIYQLGYLFLMNPAQPGYEPDNYEYMLIVQQMYLHNTLLHTAVANPYLVFAEPAPFEHAGLFVIPALFHSFLIPQALAILALYTLVILITKRILDYTTLESPYHYLAYAIVLLSPMLMQQTQLLEWRGTIFATTLQLIALYVLALAFTDGRRWQMFGASVLAVGIAYASAWMWSGGVVVFAVLLLIPLFIFLRRYRGGFTAYRVLAILSILLGIAVMFFTSFALQIILPLLSIVTTFLHGVFVEASISAPVFTTSACYNPLQISEVGCITPAQGLVVGSGFLFIGIMIWLLLAKGSMSFEKDRYRLFVIGILFLMVVELPLAMIYLRLVQLIAPLIAIALGIGILVMIFHVPASRLIILVVLGGVFVSQLAGFVSTASSDYGIYLADNPPQLVALANFTASHYANSTILTFWGWGDYMEYMGHVKSYSDTIQELNYSFNTREDNLFLLNSTPEACAYIASLRYGVDLILVSPTLAEYVTFVNASNASVIKNPLSLESCGYSVVKQEGNFYLFKKE